VTARDVIAPELACVAEMAGLTDPDGRAEQLLDAYRAEVLHEAADALDRIADDAEAAAIKNDGLAYGRSNRTVAIYREVAALLSRMAERSAT
jgi:hypothetical protein